MSDDGATRSASATAPTCPFCHAPLGDLATASCGDCGTRYHDDCLAASGRCALPGCSRDDAATPPNGRHEHVNPAPPTAARPPPSTPVGGPAAAQSPASGWDVSFPEPTAAGTSQSTTTFEDWFASLQLIWEDVPPPLRWAAGVVMAMSLLAIVVAIVDGTDVREPEVADRPVEVPDDDVFDDAVDVTDESFEPNSAGYQSLSDSDQRVCQEVNRRLRLAVADDHLAMVELAEVLGYAYRQSDYGGRLESAVTDLMSAIEDTTEGRADDGEIERAGRAFLYLCNYGY